MIYRDMPAVWDPSFCADFYARWGRESAVISAATVRIEYPEYRQLLSIKTAFGGSENYYVDGRRFVVDDDTYLILNAGRSYASRIESIWPVHSFTIFFDASLASQAWDSSLRTTESILDDPGIQGARPLEFAEQLHIHDQVVSPVLRHIRTAIDNGLDDELWLDEQLAFLLGRMVRQQHNVARRQVLVPARKPATRYELLRRLALGVDFIHAHYRDHLDLGAVAHASHLSRFYFLQVFKRVYGISPATFITRKRVAAPCSVNSNLSMAWRLMACARSSSAHRSLNADSRASRSQSASAACPAALSRARGSCARSAGSRVASGDHEHDAAVANVGHYHQSDHKQPAALADTGAP